MPRLLLAIVVFALVLPVTVSAFTREVRERDSDHLSLTVDQDCLILNYNTCSGWVWIFSDAPGAVWGTVLDPNDCPGGCPSVGAVSDIWFWGLCSPSAPATIGGVGVELVDALGCPMTPLWHSGPLTVYSCIATDRWSHVYVPIAETHLEGQPFALTVKWGPESPQMKFASDNGLGNLFCWLGYVETYPGCATTGLTCMGWDWTAPGQASYIYITDFDGDTVLDDLCELYGSPYPLWFPYVAGYGYLPNNLMLIAGVVFGWPSSVKNTSWGHVKALYE